MYVNESLPCDERDDLRHKDLEAILMQITYPSSLLSWWALHTDHQTPQ